MPWPFWCTGEGYRGPVPGALLVSGVSAEVSAPVADRVEAVRFLDEVAGWLGRGRRPQDGLCPLDDYPTAPSTAWVHGLLSAGTCAAGWCHAPGLSEQPDGLFAYFSIERRGAEWHLRSLDPWRSDLGVGRTWPTVPDGMSPVIWIRRASTDLLVLVPSANLPVPTIAVRVAGAALAAIDTDSPGLPRHGEPVVSW